MKNGASNTKKNLQKETYLFDFNQMSLYNNELCVTVDDVVLTIMLSVNRFSIYCVNVLKL